MIVLAGCLARPVVVKSDSALHAAQSQDIEQAVITTAKTGDWLVTRGYNPSDTLVANVTGLPISHVGVISVESRQLIEAEAEGVNSATLREFIDKSYRVLVIRPRWRTEANGHLAYANAAKLLGKGYDFSGIAGFNYPSKYYCSELAVLIYEPWYRENEKFPKVIKPGELYLYGEVLYDSLPRDEI